MKFAAFYEENGALIVNGHASVGRAAITATARSYTAAFPDMAVKLDSLRHEGDQTIHSLRNPKAISTMTSTSGN